MRRETMILAGLGAVMAFSLAQAATSLAAETGWTSADGTWRYVDSGGNYVTNTWKTSGDSSYYLGSDGAMETDAWIDDTYYVDENGAMVRNSWIQVSEEGGEKEPGWYYLNSNGKLETDGWKTIGSYKYNFDDDGKMRTGWYFDEDNIYYLGGEDDGAMKTGWRCLAYDDEEEPEEGDVSEVYSEAGDDAKWFYFQTSGKAKRAESGSYASVSIDGKKYYFDENGVMLSGWVAVEDETDTGDSTGISKFVYLGDDNDGTMAKSQWLYLTEHPGDSDDASEMTGTSADGAPEEGDGAWYYFTSSGTPAYLDTTADSLSEATTKVSGTSYFFDEYGCMQTGLLKITAGDAEYVAYFGAEDSDGKMRTGKQTGVMEDDGDTYTYYFTSSGSNKGAGYSGTQDGYLYWNGRLLKAESDSNYQVFEVNDKLYLVNESGKVQTGSKSYKVDGDYRYKISGGTIYFVDDDQEELGTVDSGDAQSLPAIYCHGEYVLR